MSLSVTLLNPIFSRVEWQELIFQSSRKPSNFSFPTGPKSFFIFTGCRKWYRRVSRSLKNDFATTLNLYFELVRRQEMTVQWHLSPWEIIFLTSCKWHFLSTNFTKWFFKSRRNQQVSFLYGTRTKMLSWALGPPESLISLLHTSSILGSVKGKEINKKCQGIMWMICFVTTHKSLLLIVKRLEKCADG
jgi:hypothetical protein